MAEEGKRKLSEIVALYSLEPTLRDVYVEGRTDREFLSWYLRLIGARRARAKEIDDVIFPEGYLAGAGAVSNNKAKVLALARALEGGVPAESLAPLCLVDADLDRSMGRLPQGRYVVATDYTCMEMYFWNDATLERVVCLALASARVDTAALTGRLARVLRTMFCIRVAADVTGYCESIPAATDLFRLDAQSGEMSVDAEQWISRIVNKKGGSFDRTAFRVAFDNAWRGLPADDRHAVHGDDWVHLVGRIIRERARIKEMENPETMRRVFRSSVDEETLRAEVLFMRLAEWASDFDRG